MTPLSPSIFGSRGWPLLVPMSTLPAPITGLPNDDLYSRVELEPLHSLPEFQAVFGDVIGKRKEQLEHLRAMESAGELAPIPELPANKSTSEEEQDRTTVF